jgi:hypothetical protein
MSRIGSGKYEKRVPEKYEKLVLGNTKSRTEA